MASRKVVPEVPDRIGRGTAKEETRSDNFGIPRKAKKAWKPEATDKMSLRQNSEPALSKTKKKISFKNKVKGAFNRAKSHSPIRHRFHTHRLSIRAADDAVSLQSFYQTKLLRMWEEHRSVKSNMVFIPNQKHNLIMSWLFGLTMVFTFVSVPSYAAFFLKTESNYSEHLQQEDGGLSTFLYTLLNICDWIALVDLVLQFFLAYHDDSSGILVIDHKKIVQHVMGRALTYMQFVSIIPIELLIDGMSQGWIKTVICGRRFLRAPRLMVFISKVDVHYIESNHWPAGKLLLYLVFLVHLLACMTYIIRDVEGTLEYDAVLGDRHPSDNSMYAIVMYDALLTILGEKLDNVNTKAERVFFTLAMLLGSLLNAILFGQVALAVTSFQRSALRYQEKMAFVYEQMKALGLPHDVQKRVFHFYDFMWRRNQCLDQDLFLSEVSSTLRSEINLYRHRELVHNVSFLRVIPEPACVVKLCSFLKAAFYLPGDFVVKENDYGEEMYMIASGGAEVLVNGKSVRTFSKNAFFGEMALLSEKQLRRTATIRAVAYSEFVSLSKQSFVQLMKEYPTSKEKVYEAINKQMGTYKMSTK